MVLQFVDALFEHDSFRAPNLSKESLQDDGLLDFALAVIYEARPPEPAVEAAAEETTADAGGDPVDPAAAASASEASQASEGSEAEPSVPGSAQPLNEAGATNGREVTG